VIGGDSLSERSLWEDMIPAGIAVACYSGKGF
jgi:hypothetical protein